MEVTFEELQNLLKDGKISSIQFIQILTENFGSEFVNSLIMETLYKTYDKDLLND